MRVLLFHGYLLRGTGSNVYNAALAAALVRLGHEVHLLSQERHADELEFVGAVGEWDEGELRIRRIGPAPCTVYRPNIGGLLPVYVPDRYEGLEAQPFPELSDAELGFYLEANVRAVAEVAARAHPDAGLANHLVMGPAILARALANARVPYAVKVHGSALEYTVKPHPRFLPYAREGIAAARGVLVGSRHTAESLWETLRDPGLPARTRLGPPGVDVSRFRPAGRAEALARLRRLAARAQPGPRAEREPDSGFTRDPTATERALRTLAERADRDRLLVFVGKLIVAKGIDLLLAAWPLITAEVPAASLAVVGFGAYRPAAERLVQALGRGDLAAVRTLALSGRAAEGGAESRLSYLLDFLDWLEHGEERERYMAAAEALPERVVFSGRLEHDELAELLPACEALIVPSTFPEAFGMVAVEGAACGALPISAAHSGLAEVSRVLAAALPHPVRELVSFPLGPDVVQGLSERVIAWLRTPDGQRDQARRALVHVARERYSWEGVARGVIAAAQGELQKLEPPG
jgi:glycosyltransferase involved in cell wall biosynthesis